MHEKQKQDVFELEEQLQEKILFQKYEEIEDDATAENIDAAISNIEYKIYKFACIICLRTKYQSLLLSSTSSLNLIHLLVRSTKSISVRELLIKYLFNSIFIRN